MKILHIFAIMAYTKVACSGLDGNNGSGSDKSDIFETVAENLKRHIRLSPNYYSDSNEYLGELFFN